MDNVLQIPAGQQAITPVLYQPPQAIPENKKDSEWFINNVRYIVSFYNLPQVSLYPNQTYDPNQYMGMSDEMIRNFSYYKGNQQNVDFKHTTMDFYNNEVPAVWIKGQELAGMVQFAVGVATEMINDIEWSCKSLSDDTADEWEELNAQLKAMLLLRDSLKELGVRYNPVPDAEIDDAEDAEEYMGKWKSECEIAAIKIAKAIYEENFLKNTYLKGMLHTLVGGLASIFTFVENGRVRSEHKASYLTIWDNRHDDDYNRLAQFYGFIDYYTAPELFVKYPEIAADPQKRLIVEAMARNENGSGVVPFQNYWNGGLRNISWWTYPGSAKRMTVAVATVFWKGLRFDKGDWVPDIYQGELIGNMFICNARLANNIVRDPMNKSNPLLPGRVFVPEMELGSGRSLVGRAINNQNEMDRLKFKIQEKTGRDLGKTYIINGNQLGDPEQGGVKRLMSNLKRMGVHVRNITGEANDPENGQPLIETLDMSLDSDVGFYINLYHEQERIMQRIFNYNDVTMGIQNKTIGKGVQENTIAQASTGTLSLYDSYMEYVRQDMQYKLNQWKIVNGDQKKITLVVGKEGAQVIRLTKDFQWEDLLLFIEPNDNMDKESKGRIQTLALAAAQNDRIDLIDYVEHIELNNGKRDMIKGLKMSMKRKAKEIQAQNAQQQQFEQMQAQQNIIGQQQAIVLQKVGEAATKMDQIITGKAWDYKTKIDALTLQQNHAGDIKIADAIIQNAHAEVGQAHALEQQQLEAALAPPPQQGGQAA